MTAELLIERIELSAPEPKGDADPETGEQPLWFDVSIVVQNASEHLLFVIADLRRLAYDSSKHELQLDFSELTPVLSQEVAPVFRPIVVPRFAVLQPTARLTIHADVPQIVKRMSHTPQPEGGIDFEAIDISGVQQIQCSIAFNDSSFDLGNSATYDAFRAQLNSWSANVAAKSATVQEFRTQH